MIQKQFWRNVLPAMLAFAFSGVYAIVDGFFVGRSVGDPGLAAVNIAYPVTALIQAVGTSLGLSTGIWAALSMGRGDRAAEKRSLGTGAALLLLATAAVTLGLGFFYEPILGLLGAEGEILTHAGAYLRVICWGAVFQLFSTALLPILRNYGGGLAAMVAMVAGFGVNIVLDALFVPLWGTAGAAAATVIGQGATLLPCVVFFWWKRASFRGVRLQLKKEAVGGLLGTALSPFGLTLSPNIVTVLLNWGALRWGGAGAVACYAVVGYVMCVAQLLLQGIGDGAQPLVGRCFGAGDEGALKRLRALSYRTALVTAALCGVTLFVLRHWLPALFGASAAVGAEFARVLPVFLSGLLFAAVLRITSSWFYATRQGRLAAVLIYGEPLLLAALLLVLPRLWGLGAVWAAVPTAQGLVCLLAAVLLWKKAEKRAVTGVSALQE